MSACINNSLKLIHVQVTIKSIHAILTLKVSEARKTMYLSMIDIVKTVTCSYSLTVSQSICHWLLKIDYNFFQNSCFIEMYMYDTSPSNVS